MKFKIKIMITVIVSFVVIVSMSLFIVNSNSISINGFNSDTVITGSNNSYLITLKGVPSGNGTYQQLITINNYSKYGINTEGSNIAFYDGSNLTHLYAWIQSINITTIQIWIKNYNDSSKIDMQVLSKFENLFNSTGYLGDNTTNNAKYVFSIHNANVSINGNGFIGAYYIGGNDSTLFYNQINYPSVSSYAWGLTLTCSGSYLFTYTSASNYYVKGSTLTHIPFNTTNIYASWGTANTTDIIGMNWLVDGNYGEQIGNITKQGNLEYVNYASGYARPNGIMINYWVYGLNIARNGIMPTFTIVSLYHSVDFKLLGSSFSSLWNIMIQW